ncbi:hypothetical protein BGZ80_003590 [Entomortierella chlamydospora]|uniref:Cation/H+ exchanger transmembrane domain-containing protein n=1 Tax=Entomortierella chlamydospora TaxID=101097 RepID=A0A9P6N1W7_9FUNG|nr:hypothetical protein BGZ79_000977 [Entomortierella chlamydospora]KAG0020794.1 hypothetical protein BGZ80_003590 [Entomortierella chlamydospora]
MKSYSPELAYYCLFLVSLWLSGTLLEELLQCRLLGELLIGIVFGNLGSLLPEDKSTLILAGEVGVLGLIFEAGLGTDIHKILRAGPRGTLVALIGTIVPLATGFGFISAIVKFPSLQDPDPEKPISVKTEALASGAALASTSIACAIATMKQRGMLETPLGTLITTAAMIDDVVSLVLLSIVSGIGNLASGEETGSGIEPMTIIQPIVASLGIIAFGFIACNVAAKFHGWRSSTQVVGLPTEQTPEQEPEQEYTSTSISEYEAKETCETNEVRKTKSRRSAVQSRAILVYKTFAPTIKLATMIITGFGFSILTEYLGSSRLLGAFVAGVFFSSFHSLKALYDENIEHKLQPAMSAIFFATIGFAIPLTKILDPTLFGWGIAYTVIASFSKLITAVLVPSSPQPADGRRQRSNDRWVVGTAMIARGELGLLMVQQALLQGVMGESVMIVTTWSIVLCTLIGIGALGFVMNRA